MMAATKIALERKRLIESLRRQRDRVQLSGERVCKLNAPDLYELGLAAGASPYRFVTFRGVKFPVRHGSWRASVLVPGSHEILVLAAY